MEFNVFLSGGGTSEQTYKFDDIFLKSSGERILYLPVGLKRTFSGFDGCVDWFMSMIKMHNVIKKVTTLIDLKDKNDLITIENFDAIYIGGASDTFRLHSLLKKNGTYSLIKKFIDDGGTVYGGSGGATILGRTINYDQKEKKLSVVDDLSSNVCFGYAIYPHLKFTEKNYLETQEYGKVICLPEDGGLAINTKNGESIYVGENSAFVFDGELTKQISDGEITKL